MDDNSNTLILEELKRLSEKVDSLSDSNIRLSNEIKEIHKYQIDINWWLDPDNSKEVDKIKRDAAKAMKKALIPKKDNDLVQEYIDIWNEFCTKHNTSRSYSKDNPARFHLIKDVAERPTPDDNKFRFSIDPVKAARKIKAVINNDEFSLDKVLSVVELLPYFMGGNQNGWKVNFEYIFLKDSDNWRKIMNSEKYNKWDHQKVQDIKHPPSSSETSAGGFAVIGDILTNKEPVKESIQLDSQGRPKRPDGFYEFIGSGHLKKTANNL